MQRKGGILTAKSQQTKALIDETIRELLKEKSYNELMLKDVYTRAGITPSIFYYYYDNLNAAIMYSFPMMDSHFGPEFIAGIQGLPWREKAIAYARTYGAASQLGGHYYSAQIFKAQLDSGSVVTNPRRGIYQCLISILTEGAAEFSACLSPCVLADRMIACIRGIACDWCMTKSEASLADLEADAVSMLIDGAVARAKAVN
ncbi:MAG: hypothetical protein RRY65_01345 [Pseudoflavonifractor sp.]